MIQRFCKTIKEAEKIQNKLYLKYNSVKLVRFPSFKEDGFYAWEVKDQILKCKA